MKEKDTVYHMAFRDLGGRAQGQAFFNQKITIHITRIWKHAVTYSFWYRFLEVEHHEWLHALMYRWNISGAGSERKIEWATERIMKGLNGTLALCPFDYEDFFIKQSSHINLHRVEKEDLIEELASLEVER